MRIEKYGNYYTVRQRMDVEGQEKRVDTRYIISPIERRTPGWLNRIERERRTMEILARISSVYGK